jgi:hypothetical protein
LTQVRIDAIRDPVDPDIHRWLAEFCHVDKAISGPAK